MQQAMIHGPSDLRVDDVPEPSIGARDALVAVGACGICGSDIGYVKQGGMPTRNVFPMPIGHELAGTVRAVGADVRGISPGMRVVVASNCQLVKGDLIRSSGCSRSQMPAPRG